MMMHTMLDLIKRIYPLRTCSLPLNEKSIAAGKFRVCLEYQIGNCLGPCEGHQSLAAYDASIEAIAEMLKGSYYKAAGLLRDEMKEHAAALAFEKAAAVKKKLDILENYQAKSAVVNVNITNIDVFSIVTREDLAVVNYLHMQYGAIVTSHNLEIQKRSTNRLQSFWPMPLLSFGIVFKVMPAKFCSPKNSTSTQKDWS